MLLTHKVGDTELERPFKKHPFLQIHESSKGGLWQTRILGLWSILAVYL